MAPSWSVYLHTFALVLGLGSFAAAAHVYARLVARRSGKVLRGYAVALALAVAAGALVLGPGSLVGASTPWVLAVAVPLGVLVGVGARAADRRIVRGLGRRAATGPATRSAAGMLGQGRQVGPAPGALLLGGTSVRPVVAARTRASASDPTQYPLPTVVAVAVLEEAFFRGVLVQSALAVRPAFAAGALLLLSLAAFSLAHLFFGWEHVLAKTPLGVGALLTVLLLGTLVAAVVAHVWFNVSAWRDMTAASGGTR